MSKIDWLRMWFFEQNKVECDLPNYLEMSHRQKRKCY